MGRSTVLALAVVGAFLSYTTEGQQKYRLIWRRWLLHRDLPTGGVIVEERNHLDGFGGYEKSLTRRFFGLGPNTREGDETSYIDEVIDVGGRGEFAFPEAAGAWIATVGVRGEHHDLGPGRVSGRPTTDARIHASHGVGLRFSMERTAHFRADVGFSREDVDVTVGFGLPF